MGFLHKLWDETLAGPTPDSGLGKLRKYNSLSAAATRSTAAPPYVVIPPPLDDQIPITRSITVLRTTPGSPHNLNSSLDSGSVPNSPASSSTPTSPFSPSTSGGNFKKLTRRKSTSASVHQSDPKSPTGYDWIVLSALDR
ncbi:dormancy-associated protein homolog 4-like [Olea europaea var. sylvestris]|uniref:dormancy-associated protein homolog 4-like n=1 Tax=Olea europaea var. sylvestris TaxID=158386 RepID=UPI000C1D492A|nr:dormancy-associated protein homolog 4-like [Olea europaea var. sylvestris]